MAYHRLWIAGMILLMFIAAFLASIVTMIFNEKINHDRFSLAVLVLILSFALFGAYPVINSFGSSEVILVSEKTHDVDKIIAENNLKVHVAPFTPMRPVQECIEFADNTEITYIEPGVKYVIYWTTGFGKKEMRAFEYTKKESADEKQTKINQAEIDKYKLNSSVSGNNE